MPGLDGEHGRSFRSQQGANVADQEPAAGVPPFELVQVAVQPLDGRRRSGAGQFVAQQTFERAVETGMKQYATTGDFLAMIAVTKPTLTGEMITDFAEDTASYPRT